MMNKKNYNVTIFGDQYNIVSDETQEHIAQSTAKVDTLMKEIAEKSKLSDPKRIAVLAALRLASLLAYAESGSLASNADMKKLIGDIEQKLNSL